MRGLRIPREATMTVCGGGTFACAGLSSLSMGYRNIDEEAKKAGGKPDELQELAARGRLARMKAEDEAREERERKEREKEVEAWREAKVSTTVMGQFTFAGKMGGYIFAALMGTYVTGMIGG